MNKAINLNYLERITINTNKMKWVKSPKPGVVRKRLAYEMGEKGVTTSLVKFEKGAFFPKHGHPLGEEIFVLNGQFSDEFGDYPAGTYIRNPESFSHKPFSQTGCTIFVKLRQFHPKDKQKIIINTQQNKWLPGYQNLKVMPLHNHIGSSTALVKWPAGQKFVSHEHFGGEEILVLSGTFNDEYGHYPAGTWIRSPHLSRHNPYVNEDTLILVKTGHL